MNVRGVKVYDQRFAGTKSREGNGTSKAPSEAFAPRSKSDGVVRNEPIPDAALQGGIFREGLGRTCVDLTLEKEKTPCKKGKVGRINAYWRQGITRAREGHDSVTENIGKESSGRESGVA